MGKYDDIINMTHHRSLKHPHMSATARAGQFAPFAALTGFDDDIKDADEINLKKVSRENIREEIYDDFAPDWD